MEPASQAYILQLCQMQHPLGPLDMIFKWRCRYVQLPEVKTRVGKRGLQVQLLHAAAVVVDG